MKVVKLTFGHKFYRSPDHCVAVRIRGAAVPYNEQLKAVRYLIVCLYKCFFNNLTSIISLEKMTYIFQNTLHRGIMLYRDLIRLQ